MTQQDIYLLSPEISLIGLALAIVILDIFVKQKLITQCLIGIGLVLPVIFSVLLWNGVGLGGDYAKVRFNPSNSLLVIVQARTSSVLESQLFGTTSGYSNIVIIIQNIYE